MKQLILIFTILGFLSTSNAAVRPEIVPSKLLELKSKSWYLENLRSWKFYLEENPNDETGWLELFKAASFGGNSESELKLIADKIEGDFPESSTSYYVKSRVFGWNASGINFLKKALATTEDLFLEDRLILAEYEMTDDRKLYSKKVYDAGKVSKVTMNYCYNVLMSVGEDGILFTDATHTTVPLWILQDVMSVRQDVVIISLELSQDEEYRTRKLSAYALSSGSDPGAISLSEANPDKDFFYALTLPRKNLKEIEDKLYVVGLASQYRSERLAHFESLKENIENKFLLDYLTIDFDGEPNTSLGNVLRTNYIVPFLLLKEYYDELGNDQRSNFWKGKLLDVAEKSELRSRVELLLEKKSNKRSEFVKTTINVKGWDKKMKKLKDNIYVSNTEISNSNYGFFLSYLEKNGYTDLFEKSDYDLDRYEGIEHSFHKNYHFSQLIYAKAKGAYATYPVMDITFEAARIYCEWMTAQYNVQEDRKFKKVKFRLPTQDEWTMAALGYSKFQAWTLTDNTVEAQTNLKGKYEMYDLREHTVSYPWFSRAWELRNSITNRHNCYMANVKTTDERLCKAGIMGDGFTITSPNGTYFPNQLEVFDMIGNVAEMTDVDGIAMGGSWNHPPEESTITSINNYNGRDSAVGFRLFMEVIEE